MHLLNHDLLSRSSLAVAVAATLAGCATPSTPSAPAAAATTPVAAAPAAARPAAPPAAVAGAATTPPAAVASAGGTPPAAAAAAAAGGTPPLRPFAEVIKDAKEQKGFFAVWQKDERAWLEIHPDQLGMPVFFGNSLTGGLGQSRFLPGLMGQEQIVVFNRVGNTVQLVAKNYRVRAPAGTPLARAVSESYSDSLLAAAPVVSSPHPDRKSFLVDLAALLGGDLSGAATGLEAAYRMSFAHDRANSSIERVRADDKGTSVTMKMHFSVPRLPAPPVTMPGAPPPNPASLPQPPRVVPDPRSLFLSYAYSLTPLPAEPMRPRKADERVGHFTDAFLDLGNDLGLDSRTHFVTRWRLDKKDPAAAVSEPKEPITVVMDRNIPEKYRAPVRAGILEWNKAFERAGFKDAIVVQQQAADADWTSTEHGRHLAVRWFMMEGPGATAVGPSQSDPRSGEILRGAAIIPESWARIGRTSVAETLPKPTAAESLEQLFDEKRTCTYAFDALEQLNFGLELLAERGLIDPTGPDAEKFIASELTAVTLHEVGHALGLRHNFKASTGVKFEQLRDAAYVRERGTSNSVMDYNALNLPLEREPASVYNMTTLGEYDYWAIEYAYKPLAAETEKAELAKIAARQSGNPALAYATDEDAIGAIDPTANQFDLGDDPLAFARRTMLLARELWTRTQARELKDGESFLLYRRNLQRGLSRFGNAAGQAVKYIGGVITSREVPGAAGNRALFVPVSAAKQREALNLLTSEVFSSDSFRFDAKFMRRLGVDQLDRWAGASPMINTDFSLATSVLGIQRAVLDQLMSDTVAIRLADAENKVAPAERRALLSFADVHVTLADAVWSELKSGRDIDSMRRNLQREHVRRIAAAMVRASPTTATDVRPVNRQVALKLEADLRRAVAASKGSAVTRAHVADSLATLSEALKAPLVKAGV